MFCESAVTQSTSYCYYSRRIITFVSKHCVSSMHDRQNEKSPFYVSQMCLSGTNTKTKKILSYSFVPYFVSKERAFLDTIYRGMHIINCFLLSPAQNGYSKELKNQIFHCRTRSQKSGKVSKHE